MAFKLANMNFTEFYGFGCDPLFLPAFYINEHDARIEIWGIGHAKGLEFERHPQRRAPLNVVSDCANWMTSQVDAQQRFNVTALHKDIRIQIQYPGIVTAERFWNGQSQIHRC